MQSGFIVQAIVSHLLHFELNISAAFAWLQAHTANAGGFTNGRNIFACTNCY
jgi:hypothetical protein